eukprot:m.182157 g.182157  ORF g.182157 m.182157 type:complete len:85 (+) comp16879_c0_seq17:3081-3335(+)
MSPLTRLQHSLKAGGPRVLQIHRVETEDLCTTTDVGIVILLPDESHNVIAARSLNVTTKPYQLGPRSLLSPVLPTLVVQSMHTS